MRERIFLHLIPWQSPDLRDNGLVRARVQPKQAGQE